MGERLGDYIHYPKTKQRNRSKINRKGPFTLDENSTYYRKGTNCAAQQSDYIKSSHELEEAGYARQ